MRRRITTLAIALCALAVVLPGAAQAASAPAWKFTITSQPTNFKPGADGNARQARYILLATNVGAGIAQGAGASEITIEDTLPAGLTPLEPGASSRDPDTVDFTCDPVVGQKVRCTSPGPVHPGHSIWAEIPVDVSASEGEVLSNEATIKGGAALPVQATTLTTISASTPPFDFLEGDTGLSVPIVQEDGTAASVAGSHPHGAVIDLGFPTEEPGGLLTSTGHPRKISVDLPRGLLANPLATPTRCTEAQLTSEGSPGCPDSSQVGVVTMLTTLGSPAPSAAPLYSMVPTHGTPAVLGFDALGVGIFPHILPVIRSSGDFGISGVIEDILSRGLNPILNVRVELWGDPSADAHDFVRGSCLFEAVPPCEEKTNTTAFLTVPGDCPDIPLAFKANASSWEEPELSREAQYESASLSGLPARVEECGTLVFRPKIEGRPTTNLIDSPSGLDLSLRNPQELGLEGRYSAAAKDILVTLPEGMVVNVPQADGLEACASTEVGLLSPSKGSIRFNAKPSHCPNASKIGVVEAKTPLLDHPVEGAIYVAKPFDNPFNSLTAAYLVTEDAASGILIKLAMQIEPDPLSGRLTMRIREVPELPVEELSVDLFAGARAPLQTPLTCTVHAIAADLIPWSAPQAEKELLADSFQLAATPADICPSTAAEAPNMPSFRAGTLLPRARTFSPLVLRLSREDGSQRIGSFEATLPSGLLAKLAGVPYCPEVDVAAATARSQPNQGALEQASPSCPAASEVGTVDVGVGAGPNPLHMHGGVYLAGPYRGAPLSVVIVVPAVAGPFDLGVATVRAAIMIDPITSRIRVASDQLPKILHGIPVNMRSMTITFSRPGFTLNPTSCDPLAFDVTAVSTLRQPVALQDPFQIGNCRRLPFKPGLSTRLFGPTRRGSHPSFRAVLTAGGGSANIARTAVTLPRSVFLDQSRIHTICTRAQFATDRCPDGSIYGKVKVLTPLLDHPLKGPVYLRSSRRELPDLVLAPEGPSSQPIKAELVGHVDSVGGRIRVSFDTLPDVPIRKTIVSFYGSKKGVLQNSTGICRAASRVGARMDGQNGKFHDFAARLRADC